MEYGVFRNKNILTYSGMSFDITEERKMAKKNLLLCADCVGKFVIDDVLYLGKQSEVATRSGLEGKNARRVVSSTELSVRTIGKKRDVRPTCANCGKEAVCVYSQFEYVQIDKQRRPDLDPAPVIDEPQPAPDVPRKRKKVVT